MNYPPVQQIIDYLEEHRQNMAYFLRWLALAESPSLVPQSQDKVFGLLANKLAEMDFVVKRLRGRQSGGLLYARPRRRVHKRPAQLLLGHSDTVWPLHTLKEMPVTVDGHRMFGPGVYDMKGGLVQMLFALQALSALDLEPTVTPLVLVNSDEEIGSMDSTRTIQRLARLVDRVLVLEPSLGPLGKLKTARKGVMRFTVQVQGKAAHAGLAPEEGISAILELSYVIQKLYALNDPDRGITVNVGSVDGGLRPNVVAPESRAEVDVRVPTLADAQRVLESIMGLTTVIPGTSIRVQRVENAPPMEPTSANRRLWMLARELGEAMGLVLEEARAGGASDGNTTSQWTATLDGLGPVGGGAHARHEFVDLDSLVERGALLALLVMAPPLTARM